MHFQPAMSALELEHLAADRPLVTPERFTPNDFYGSAAVLKRRAGLPAEFVLRAVMPHGPNISTKLWDNELKHPWRAVLALSAAQAGLYQQQSDKAVHVIGSPLFHAAELIGPELDAIRSSAAGTIVFPTHSTHHVTVEFDRSELIAFLRALPAEFQPVRVCLYWRDIQLGRHREFLAAGFECTTAGHMFDPAFPYRLLRLLAAHRDAVANKLGSSVYYAAAFGLPVRLLDQPASFSGSDARFLNELSPEFDLPGARRFLDVSRRPRDEAAPLQRAIAREEMGLEFVRDPSSLRALPATMPAELTAAAAPAPTRAQPARHVPASARFTADAATATLVQTLRPLVAKHPRRTPGRIQLDGRPLAYADLHSLYHQSQQIFGQKLYDFRPATLEPLIIDGGAHIGLASLSFARQFPQATIHAFEADPRIAELLAANVEAFQLGQVRVHPRALWTSNDGVRFDATADDSGHITPGAGASTDVNAGTGPARVPSVRLRDFLAGLSRPVDLLKLDIEGAEFAVVADCDGALGRVQNLLVEVHRFRDGDGQLGELLGVLERNGFEYSLGDLHAATWIESRTPPPFTACASKHYIVTVFAWRPVAKAPATGARPLETPGLLVPAATPARTVPSPARLPDAVLRAAVEHLNARREAEALRDFDEAIRAGAGPRSLYGRGLALARLERRDDALAALGDLLRAVPGHTRARALAEELARAQTASGRIYIASYPRSGNTWLRLLLADVILQGHGYSTDTTLPIHADHVIPDLHAGRPEDVDRRLQLPGVLLKSHDRFDKLPPGRAVCIFRQAADALTSYYHFHRRYPHLAPKAADGVDAFCRRHVGHWQAHLESFLEAHRRGADLMFVSYESLHADSVAVLERVAQFVGVPAAEKMCRQAVDNHAFDRQQAAEKKAHGDKYAVPFFRQGQVNGARAELTPETLAFLQSETDALYQAACALEPARLPANAP